MGKPPSKNQPRQVDTFYTNKVYQTLAIFDAQAIKRLTKFLNSPYFNQSKTLIQLYETFLSCLEKNKSGFDREQVWNLLFPEAAYDDVNFRKYCSDLLKLVEGFLAQETVMQNPTRRQIDLLDYVVRQKVEPLYSSALRQARNSMASQSYRSLDFFKNMYEIERLYYEMMDYDVTLSTRANIEEISNNLDLFYWIEKLKLYSSVLSQQRTGNYQYDLRFNDEILDYLNKISIDEAPELGIYYYSFLTLYDEKNDQHYFKLRKLLDKYGGVMPERESIELYDSALHYCTGKVNTGNQQFLKEYFDLFEDGLNKGIFIINEELATWRFNNTTAIALRLGKIEWAEDFIEKYKQYLPADTRENTYTFNLARLYRYQRKFDKVLALLHNLEYEDIMYNLLSKTMLINAYYELEEQDALESYMESFRVFLNRHKNIPQQRKKNYLNLLKYVRRLTRITPNDKTALAELKTEVIREKANHVNHEWLLEKISELE